MNKFQKIYNKAISQIINEDNNILYSAIVLDDISRKRLLKTFKSEIPDDWKIIYHHMIITFGKGIGEVVSNKDDINKVQELTTIKLSKNEKDIAVQVERYLSNNNIPHITLAISPTGKPVDSNKITEWSDIDQIKLSGRVNNIIKNKAI